MGMHTLNSNQEQYNMKTFAVGLIFALAIQNSLQGSVRAGNMNQMPSEEEMKAAITQVSAVLCQCDDPIPQWANWLFGIGESCEDDDNPMECIGIAMGLLNADGSYSEELENLTAEEVFADLHGGSDEFDAALDTCYSQAFDDVSQLEDMTHVETFGECMEKEIAKMCHVDVPRALRKRNMKLRMTREAMSRDLCSA